MAYKGTIELNFKTRSSWRRRRKYDYRSKAMTNGVTAPSQNNLLPEVRSAVLHLHQTLLNLERRNFERIHGSVTSGELLQLVLNHPQFAWLRIISALMTQIDELLDTNEPAADEEVTALIEQLKQLFALTENEEFRFKYQTALQHEPEIVMAHAALMKLLRSNP